MISNRTIRRFWSKVDTTGDCWIWLASTSDGYGNFWMDNRKWKAHRFSYELEHGPIPEGLIICHRCDDRKCVRPEHLFLGTHKDNSQDREKKGRGGDFRGENNWCSLLTEDEVREILYLYRQGDTSQTELGERFGVRQTAISAITRGINWSHINSEILPKFIVKGERHGFAKLTEEQIIEIRRLYSLGEYSCADVARLFNTNRQHIWSIISGKSWKHLL